ncbi:hypothetical protein E4U36_003999 [Claviceps purpurea]|nr:hypothetical protein E4U36_003999 [Claviceps purpurea]
MTIPSPEEGETPETTSPPKRPHGSALASSSADPLPPRVQPPRQRTLNSQVLNLMIWVLYWNTRKRNSLIDIALKFDVELDVIAIQELNNGDKIPQHSSLGRYQMAVYVGRTAIYIHKRHGPETWTGRREWIGAR